MDMIGGGFGVELPQVNNFHLSEGECCAYLNSGRAALECILVSMPQRPARAFVPRFTCNTILQPFEHLDIPVIRYELSGDLCTATPQLPVRAGREDLLLLTDYFGMSDSAHLAALARAHPGPCVVDAATALYAPPMPDVPCFYSLRKFAGVPDGGVAVAPYPLKLPAEVDISSTRAVALWERTELGAEASLPAFDALERDLIGPPKRMSRLTRILIGSIDWQSGAERRLRNYRILHEQYASVNRFSLPDTPPVAPYCYPLLSGIPGLRDELIDAHIALPFFWPEVIQATDAHMLSNYWARALLPIPCHTLPPNLLTT